MSEELRETLTKMAAKIAALERMVGRMRLREGGAGGSAPVAEWQNWTPVQTGWTTLPAGNYRWCRIGNLVTCVVMAVGTSNSPVAELSLPVQASSSAAQFRGACGLVFDSGAQQATPGSWYVGVGATAVKFFKTMTDGSAWTASGSKRIFAVFQYEVE